MFFSLPLSRPNSLCVVCLCDMTSIRLKFDKTSFILAHILAHFVKKPRRFNFLLEAHPLPSTGAVAFGDQAVT